MEKYTVIVDDDGNIRWYQDNNIHRSNGPAIEYADGSKAWYHKGKFHRINKPAVEYSNGYRAWYREGKLHRLDGPAVEHPNGAKEWYINEREYSQDEFEEITNPKIKELTVEEISTLLGYKIKIMG